MTPERAYYGGDGWLKGSAVRKLEPTNWERLFRAYFSVPHVFKFTRAAYHAMSAEDQKKAKSAPYIIPASLKPGETSRELDNVDTVAIVCLDIDDAGESCARDFTESPEAISDALWPYSFVAYTTCSHLPERPRLRVMVPCEPCRLEDYPKFVRHVANLLGLPFKWSGHRESNVAVQPMAKPCMFEGEEFTSVIANRDTGVELTALDIPEQTAEDVERTYAYQGSDADWGLASLPILTLSVEDIREPLFKINPDCDYLQWTRLCCAIRHNYRDEESAREAYELFTEWSQTGAKYVDGCTYEKWVSFRPDSKIHRSVTIRTLLKQAIQDGWDHTKLSTRFKAGFTEWLDACNSADMLTAQGPKRIAEMPFKDEMVEAAMIEKLRHKIAALPGGCKLPPATIKSSVAKARQAVKAQEVLKDKPTWLLPWCFVRTADCFFSTITGVQLKPEAFNRAFGKELVTTEEAVASGRPSIAPSDFMLNVHRHEQVDGLMFDPRQGSLSEPFFDARGKRFANLFRYSTIPAIDKKNAAAAGRILDEHLAISFADPLDRQRVKDWMAFQVQFPGRKIRWVLLIQGAQGSGKTMIARVQEAVLGKENVSYANSSTIKQQWNDWAVDAQLVVIEEIWLPGKGRTEIANSLKDIITNDTIVVNRRNTDPYTQDHFTIYAAFSNAHEPIPVEETDRRYYMVRSSIQTKEQVLALTDRMVTFAGEKMLYFERFARLVKFYGGALRQNLLDHEISPSFDPDGPAPQTAYRDHLVEASKNPLQSSIEDLVQYGESPMIARDLILYETVLGRTAALAKQNHPPSHYLYKMGYEPFNGTARFQVNGSRSQVWVHSERYDEAMFGDPVAELKRRYDAIAEDSI